MGYFDKFTSVVKKGLNPKTQPINKGSVLPFAFSAAELPKIVEKKNQEWVLFGDDNNYPDFLKGLLYGSSTHNSIVMSKIKMTAGNGLLLNGALNEDDSKAVYDGLDVQTKEAFDLFYNNPNNEDNALDVIEKLSHDKQTYGAFAYEIVWNSDFTKIVNWKHVDVSLIRCGKYEGGKIKKFYYSRNWADVRNNPPVTIHACYKGNRESYNQLVYEKDGMLDYYGTPSYIGGINWIKTESEMAVFHRSNIENGMSPGLHFKFYKLPSSKAEEDEVIAGIKKTWQGAKNTGKMLATFSEGKDTAMDVEPIEVSNLDKQLLLLAQLCDQKILTAHNVTSPLLFGISTAGQLGGNTELKTAYNIFDNEVIAYDRNKIARSLQKNILDINKVNIKIEINPFDPFKEREVVKAKGDVTEALNSLSPLVANKVLESMTVDEIRSIVGLSPKQI